MPDAILDGFFRAPAQAPLRLGFIAPQENGLLAAKRLADPERAIVTSTGRAPLVEPAPTINPGLAELRTFATDWLFRVHVIPAAIKVSNPVEGSPIRFLLWSAFPWPNPLDGIAAEGETGLELTVAAGVTWKGWEQREEGVIVTRAAPPIVSALYLFDFRHGEGTLTFEAERATVIKQHAQVPVVERLEWQTDVLRSVNGATQRVSVRRHPRRKLSYDILAASEQEIRELAIVLAGKIASPLVLPIWAEPCKLTAPTTGSPIVSASAALSELKAGDTAYLESADRSQGELVRVASVDRVAGTITLADPIVRTFAAGDYLYPCVIAYIPDGSGMDRFQTNAARARIEATVTERAPIVGNGATVPTYDGLPLLNRRPAINGTAAESYALNHELIDFGGAIASVSAEDIATVTRPRVYEIADQAELQFWRAFLAQVRGRSREFYTPTFRPNFVAAVSPPEGANEIFILAEPDTFSFWMDLSNRRDIYLEREDGSGVIRRVTAITDQGDGTLKASFAVPVRAVGDPAIVSISMLERARLASDSVEITHLNTGARIALSFEAGRNDGADV